MIYWLLLPLPVLIAVLDTGAKGDWPNGWNAIDSSSEIQDTNGHGTQLIEEIRASSQNVNILPIQVSRNGHDLQADPLMRGIKYASAHGARIILVAMGMRESSPELEKAVLSAIEAGTIVVAAAGHGLENPFRPQPLSTLTPQRLPGVIVVGEAPNRDTYRVDQNFGPELSFVVLRSKQLYSGSSFSAARASGRIGEMLYREPYLTSNSVMLRMSASIIPRPTSIPIERFGLGVLKTN